MRARIISSLHYLGTISSLVNLLEEINKKMQIEKCTFSGSHDLDPAICDYLYCNHRILSSIISSQHIREILLNLFFIPLRVKIIIAVGEVGLLVAYLFRLLFRKDYVYFCDEIPMPSKNILSRLYFFIIRMSILRSKFIVIQDSGRKDLLFKVFNLNSDNCEVLYLTNTISTPNKQKDFHSIPHKVLWSGNLSKINDNGILEFVKSIIDDKNRPYHLTLILRNCNDAQLKSKLISLVAGDNRISILQNLDFRDFLKQIDLHDIGLVLYYLNSKVPNSNVELIGKSSGQLNLYMNRGLPCVVEYFNSFKFLGDSCLFVRNIHEIDPAIRTIIGTYRNFTRKAYIVYSNELNNIPQINSIIERIY